MARKLSKAEELEKLTKIWYQKAKNSGFKDIETKSGQLKPWAHLVLNDYSQAEIDAKLIYYRLANHFLNDYQFETILDKVIWEYHAAGVGVRRIAEELYRVKITRQGRQSVYRTVKRLQKIMYELYKTESNNNDE